MLAIHGDADRTAAYEGNGLMGFHYGNPSVAARMGQWAVHNRCAPSPIVTHPHAGLTVTRWQGCAAPVVLETIHGWGHEWPRAEKPSDPGVIDATTTVLDFLGRYSRRSA